MKAYILTFSLILLTAAGSFAQSTRGTGGVRRGGSSLEITQDTKERLKTVLKINDAQVDSVAAIQQTYQFKIRALKTDNVSPEETKRAKIAELEAERKQKLGVILTDEQIGQLDHFMTNRKRIRQGKQG